MIKSLVVIFKSVDYYSTFQNLFNTLYEANDYSGGLPYNKTQICNIINKMSYAHYLLFQNQFEYEPMTPEEFFKIEESQIFINDEAKNYIEYEHPRPPNSLICVLDLSNKSSYVFGT